MTGPLRDLPRITDATSHRISTWDRSGGNRDFITIDAGATVEIAAIEDPGVIRHLWMTSHSNDDLYLRKVVLRAYWDGEPDPSIEVPIGDFFGMGHARTANFWSMPLQMSPEDGRGFNSWFPMPFTSARLTVQNESDSDVVLYFYIDYELSEPEPGDVGRFHAQWRRQRCIGIDESGMTNDSFLGDGVNLDGADNYVILEATGRGHYVGCCLSIDNQRDVGIDRFNWYGEGDDMIFVDGEPFPPSLHGTGTEDYFNTAYCPTEAYSSPYHGIILPGGRNWRGKISLYRFHIEDAVRFRTSIRAAYWYQLEPHSRFPELPSVSDRLPLPDAGGVS